MLTEKIYSWFDNIRLEKEKQEVSEKINFAPSYINGCKRQIYYKKTREPASNPIDTHAYIKFELGKVAHIMIQEIFQNVGIWKEGEDFKEINWKGLDWIYRHDGILQIDNYEYLTEIKSTYSNGWYAIEEAAKPEHELQLLLYMIWEKVDRGIILYVGRDNGRLKEYHFDRESLYMKHREYIDLKCIEFKGLTVCIINKQLPDRDFQISMKNKDGVITTKFQKDKVMHNEWRCDYCQWKDTCWKEELERIKSYKFYVNGVFE